MPFMQTKGGGLFDMTPPPYPRKFLSLPFCYLIFWASRWCCTKEFVPSLRHGVKNFPSVCVHSNCSQYIEYFKRSAKSAQLKHFPLLWYQLTHVLICSSPLAFFCILLAHVSNLKYNLSHTSPETEAGGAC